MKTKKIITSLCFCILTSFCLCNCKTNSTNINPQLDTSTPVTLYISGGWVESPGFETIAYKFSQKYPNCTIEYEYLQNYSKSLLTRLNSNEDKIDLFTTNNIQKGSEFLPYALELYEYQDIIDFSNMHEGLIKNFTFVKDNITSNQIYAIPMGAELRGTYVNKTLLDSLNIRIPANRDEFFAACEILKDNGYIPIQANPAYAGHHLMYPYICNLIANSTNYNNIYKNINNCEPGISEMFYDPLKTLYTIVENNYYDYKESQNKYANFVSTSNKSMSMDFLNIKSTDNGVTYTKIDDIGNVAFMPSIFSLNETLSRLKEDYHSKIDYEFILSPISTDGGYAYMSPASGIAVNKSSDHIDWALEFLSFFFEESNNKIYAQQSNIIPCTKDALQYITEKFDIAEDHVCQLGDVSFNYNFYELIVDTLSRISKCNNPKYMIDNGNGTLVLPSFEYFMEDLEKKFELQRLEGTWKQNEKH